MDCWQNIFNLIQIYQYYKSATMSEANEVGDYSDSVQEMIKFFGVLTKEYKHPQEIEFADVIPLLSESYFNGETDDEKLDEYLTPLQNADLIKKLKNKFIEIKEKQTKKLQKSKEKQVKAKEVSKEIAKQNTKQSVKQTPKEVHKEAPKQTKQKGKIFDRIESAPRQEGAPKKRVKVEKDKSQQQPKQKGQDEEMGNDHQQKKGLKRELEKEGKQKCRFFPFCKNEETCEYFHPTEKLIQCKYFPSCKHGDNCLYAHEACKFAQNCTKPGCPYVHPFKKNNIIQQLMMGYFQGQNHPFMSKKKGGHKHPGGMGQNQQGQKGPKQEEH